ncbi:MAG: DUF2752 domain-containing protein [Acidimicrobiales bacterium]
MSTAFARVGRARGFDLLPVTAGALVVGTLVASAGADDGVVLCPLRRCTGAYCPGCGATRAANRLVRGDVSASWSHHPWIVLAAAQIAVLIAVIALTTPASRASRLRSLAVPLLAFNCVLMIGIWVVRLSTEAIPTGWF